MNNLAPQQWLQLKKSTRDALVKIFKIPQSTYTHVVNNVVESDGHTFDDLKAISIESMRELTHSASESFEEQFKLIISMVESDGSVSPEAQPENATQNVNQTNGSEQVSTPVSGTVAETTTGNPGSEETKKNDQGEVLPVSGGEQQVNRGRDELLPDTGSDDRTGVATKEEEVGTQQPETGKDDRSKTPGRKKN